MRSMVAATNEMDCAEKAVIADSDEPPAFVPDVTHKKNCAHLL